MNDPAFPMNELDQQTGYVAVQHFGMSLRDFFAAKAMHGVFTNPISSSAAEQEYIARHAYRMADAMLAERAKGGAA